MEIGIFIPVREGLLLWQHSTLVILNEFKLWIKIGDAAMSMVHLTFFARDVHLFLTKSD